MQSISPNPFYKSEPVTSSANPPSADLKPNDSDLTRVMQQAIKSLQRKLQEIKEQAHKLELTVTKWQSWVRLHQKHSSFLGLIARLVIRLLPSTRAVFNKLSLLQSQEAKVTDALHRAIKASQIPLLTQTADSVAKTPDQLLSFTSSFEANKIESLSLAGLNLPISPALKKETADFKIYKPRAIRIKLGPYYKINLNKPLETADFKTYKPRAIRIKLGPYYKINLNKPLIDNSLAEWIASK